MSEEENSFSVLFASSHYQAHLEAFVRKETARLAFDAAQGKLEEAEAKLQETKLPVKESPEYRAWKKAIMEGQ